MGSILGSGRSPEVGNGNPLQCSWLDNPMDRGDWWAAVRGVVKTWTRQRPSAHAGSAAGGEPHRGLRGERSPRPGDALPQ